jgi:uroporphyrinogen decarboxylase
MMDSRERVLRTFHYEKTDRIPVDYFANPIIHGKVAERLGVRGDDPDAVLDAFDVDFRSVDAPYRGRPLFPDRPDRRVDPALGFVTRYVTNESGGYWDFCDFPLQNAQPETIATFPIADPDDFDYAAVAPRLAKHGTRALYAGNAGWADIINSTGRLMGMEDTLVNLATEDEATLAYIDRAWAMELEGLERTLLAAKGRIDFLWLGEDLGTQRTPMISLDLYRKVLRPRHQQYIDLGKAFNLPVMVHTCGSSSWAYEDFIAMGVDAVDTLQPEATDMSPDYLIAHFGGRLAFHGCISTAGPLAFGAVADVESDVRNTIDRFRPHGGYFLAPTHEIQDNTPAENVLALYRTAHEYGRFR